MPKLGVVGFVSTPVVAVHLVALSIWLGSLVAIAVVASSSRRVLDDRSRIALFASVGRAYAVVGPVALVIAIVTGLVTAGSPSSWSVQVQTAAALSFSLIIVSIIAMAQAHRMTGLRRQLASSGGDAQLGTLVSRQAALAGALRGAIALLTLAAVVCEAAAVVAAR